MSSVRIQKGFARLALVVGGLGIIPVLFWTIVATQELLTRGQVPESTALMPPLFAALALGAAALVWLLGWVISGFVE